MTRGGAGQHGCLLAASGNSDGESVGIELLHFVGGLLNNFAQFGVGDIL